MEKYRNRISYLRGKMGLTQKDLASKIGITRAALSHYETNRRQPDFTTLKKIANFFKVSIDFLLEQNHRPVQVESDIEEFVKHLELSDEKILKQFTLTIDGEKLTKEEAKQFIMFIRAHRSLKE